MDMHGHGALEDTDMEVQDMCKDEQEVQVAVAVEQGRPQVLEHLID